MRPIRIGILGGIGPEATGEFYLKLINEFQKQNLVKDNTDFPQIIINSIPAPELIFCKISNDMVMPYLIGLKELEELGVDFIVMVCNTLHFFYEQLQNEVKIPIVDLRKEVINNLMEQGFTTITVLGTLTTVKEGLYSHKSINFLNPTDFELDILGQAIFKFNQGIEKNKQIGIAKAIAEKYSNKGAQKIILGCTELSLMLEDSALPTIDTIDILVAAVISKIKNLKLSV